MSWPGNKVNKSMLFQYKSNIDNSRDEHIHKIMMSLEFFFIFGIENGLCKDTGTSLSVVAVSQASIMMYLIVTIPAAAGQNSLACNIPIAECLTSFYEGFKRKLFKILAWPKWLFDCICMNILHHMIFPRSVNEYRINIEVFCHENCLLVYVDLHLKSSYQWLSARLQHLQCISNGDATVLS